MVGGSATTNGISRMHTLEGASIVGRLAFFERYRWCARQGVLGDDLDSAQEPGAGVDAEPDPIQVAEIVRG